MEYKIITLGCKVNACDSSSIGAYLEAYGLKLAQGDAADIYIVNSCAVTAESERKSRNMVRRMKKTGALVAVCGCWPRVNTQDAESLTEADIVITAKAPEETAQHIIDFLKNYTEISSVKSDKPLLSSHYFEGKTRASLKVQDGCNRFCTYCVIPYARCSLTSADPNEVVAKVKEITLQGYSEIVLTGIHLASYSFENTSLASLIVKISSETDLKRLRLGSLEPKLIDDEFLAEVSKADCLCPHFHLSLQSGSDSVLKRMNRRYTCEEYYEAVKKTRSCFRDAMITTDIIVGFPQETQAEFEETLAFVEKVRFAHVHVFPYSRRAGTKAYGMSGQLTRQQKHERAALLIETCENISNNIYSEQKGKIYEVLAEQRNENGLFEGYTQNYLRAQFASEEDVRGKIVACRIEGSFGDTLTASEII